MHLAGHASGRVALTDIHDAYVEDALQGLEAGAFVACRVLPGGPLHPRILAALSAMFKAEAAV